MNKNAAKNGLESHLWGNKSRLVLQQDVQTFQRLHHVKRIKKVTSKLNTYLHSQFCISAVGIQKFCVCFWNHDKNKNVAYREQN